MKLRKVATRVAVTAVAVGSIPLAFALTASAAAPPWESPSVDPSATGTITLYSSTGQVVTSGSNLAHLADYAAASSVGRAGATKASLSFAAPDHTKDPGAWFAGGPSTASTFPAASAPAPVNGLSTPVASLKATEANLQSFIGTVDAPDTTSGYNNIWQLRLKDSGPGLQPATTYWTADVQVDINAGTWTLVYPEPPSSSPSPSTSASASPSSSPSASPSSSPSASPSASPSSSPSASPSVSPSASPSASPSSSPSTSPTGVPSDKPIGTASIARGTHRVGAGEPCDLDVEGADSATVQWFANSVEIPGADGAIYRIHEKYYGQMLKCVVTATNGAGSTVIESSAAKVGKGAALKAVGGQGLAGSFRQGSVATCRHGGWSPLYTGFHFQWYLDGKKYGPNNTSDQLRIGSNWAGRKLECLITAHRTDAWADGRFVTPKRAVVK